MSFGSICSRCSRQLHKFLSTRSFPNFLTGYPLRRPFGWRTLHKPTSTVHQQNPQNDANNGKIRSKMHHSSGTLSQSAEQKANINHSPNIFMSFGLEPCNSSLESDFGETVDIRQAYEVIDNHKKDLTPQDLCIIINKLWECIWAVRDDIDRWLDYSDVLVNHKLLPQICSQVILHADSLSNSEALNILYLLLKFGAPQITSNAIASLYHSLSLRIHSFGLSDAAMLVRCSQSVKDVIPIYNLDCDEGRSVIENVLQHVQEVLDDFDEHQPEALSRLLLGFLHCSVDVTHPVICQLVQRLHSAVDDLGSSHLAPLSKAVFMMNRQRSNFAGRMTNRISEILDDIASPSDFSHVFFTLVTLCSMNLEDRMTEAFTRLYVKGASYGFNDIRRVMQGATLMRSKENRDKIISKSGELLVPQVPLIPPIELAIIYSNLRKVYSTNYELRRLLERQIESSFMSSSAPHHRLALIEVLSHDPRPDLRQEIVNIASEVVPDLSVERLSRLCNSVGRMRVRSGRLPAIIEAYVLENLDKITDLTTIKNVAQYLTTARSSNSDLMAVLIGRLHSSLGQAIAPGPLALALDALSHLGVPSQDIDPEVWDKVLAFMPKFSGNDLRRVFFVLSAYSHHLNPKSYDEPIGLLKLLNYVREPLYSSTGAMQASVKDANGNDIVKHYSKSHYKRILDPSRINDSSSAVAFAKFFTQHRIYNQEYLAAIESTIHANLDDLSPFHVLDILEAFACANFTPASPAFLPDLCEKRIVPYMSDMQPLRLIRVALNFVSLQYFSEELLQTIFHLDFLESLEQNHVSKTLSYQLQELNRAVCIECPELRIPWFSQDQSIGTAGKFIPHGVRLDVQYVLQEILGGLSFLRRNVHAPYAYRSDFECMVDRHGYPVEYGHPNGSLNTRYHHQDEDPMGSFSPIVYESTATEEQLPAGVQRIAVDIIPPTELCCNVTRFSSRMEMKRRHLEILGYHYITIPYTTWNLDLLTSFQAKRSYILDQFNGRLSLAAVSSEGGIRSGSQRSGRSGDMVERMLRDWGEDEE